MSCFTGKMCLSFVVVGELGELLEWSQMLDRQLVEDKKAVGLFLLSLVADKYWHEFFGMFIIKGDGK